MKSKIINFRLNEEEYKSLLKKSDGNISGYLRGLLFQDISPEWGEVIESINEKCPNFLDVVSERSGSRNSRKIWAKFLIDLVNSGSGGGSRYDGWWVLPDPDGNKSGWWSDEHNCLIKVITNGKQQVVLTQEDDEYEQF